MNIPHEIKVVIPLFAFVNYFFYNIGHNYGEACCYRKWNNYLEEKNFESDTASIVYKTMDDKSQQVRGLR